MKQLREIQNKLKVKKGQRNTFGKYNYRSTSDILEALKPILKDLECSILMTDRIIEVGNRNYIEAYVTLSNGKESVSATGLAREPEIQKGMSASQITGTASSYARKYALSGLFAIDDTDVVDSQDNTKPEPLPTLEEGTEQFKAVAKFMSSEKGDIEKVKGKYTLTGEVLELLNNI
jgi:hypothetical protein